MNDHPQENTPRVLALAVAFFGGLAVLGYANDVYSRLGAELVASLALFAAGYLALTVWLDPGMRALVRRLLPSRGGARKVSAGSATIRGIQA